MKSKIYCILASVLATALSVGAIYGVVYLAKPNDAKCLVSGFIGALLVLWYYFFKFSNNK